eukprot:GGOE01037164.1.p1 GENE.GGOE01037164.1~~GGOE01037164.1.p1  ORF type:complete len:557 (-),score=178.10 GGOE01037164.1:214-1863(-)
MSGLLRHDAPDVGLCEPPGPRRHPCGAQLQEFTKVLCGRELVPWALARSYGGSLKRSRLRTLYWRLTMGYFPRDGLPPPEPPRRCSHGANPSCLEHNIGIMEGWMQVVAKRRQEYRALKARMLAPPNVADVGEDATENNPLQHGNPEWRAYFRRLDWSKVAEKDLARLDLTEYLDAFFALPQVQVAMRAVLMTWAAANADVGYKQGMHELVAVLLMLVIRDSRRRALEEEQLPPLREEDRQPEARLRRVLNAILDFQEYEADCFALLDLLLNKFRLREWYIQGEHTSEASATDRCLHIQNSLVSKVEPMLAEHLFHLGVQPQVYALRWLRLLFLREFVLEDCFVLWDAVFAHGYATGEGCDLARWIMVAMLRYVKTDLLEADYARCIRRLMRFPPAPDVHLFVCSGLELSCSEIGLKLLMTFEQDELLAQQEEEYREQSTPLEPPWDGPTFAGSPPPSDKDGGAVPKPRAKSLFDSDSDEEDAEAHMRRQMALLLSSDGDHGNQSAAPTAAPPKPPGLPRAVEQLRQAVGAACIPVSENPLADDDALSD